MKEYVLSLDQGTTSSRAIVFNRAGKIVSVGQYPYEQIYPQSGWVEHDPELIWETERMAAEDAVKKAEVEISAIGITNQRETTIIWEKSTGKPIHNAIVWQCRRTASICDMLSAKGYDEMITEKTGLMIDAYFSGTKIKWILDHVPGAWEKAKNGELLFGTVETWIIWKLTGGKAHVTDYSNASRTMLFNIHNLEWDEDLCEMLDIPMCMLPKPVGNSELYGVVAEGIPGLESLAGVPVCGAAGDQQAALFGQGCFDIGDAKNTYGIGCFTLMNIGEKPVRSNSGLVTTVAWSIGGKTTYAMEGSVFNGGSTIQWLRDGLGIIDSAPEVNPLAESVKDSGGVILVPAFTGLGAPHWDMYARGALLGITRGTTKAYIARAALEGIAYQVTDMINAMRKDANCDIAVLHVDGGASVSNLMMQIQSDLLRIPVERPKVVETTAFGAAALAGLYAGVWNSLEEIAEAHESERTFYPERPAADAEKDYNQWKRAVGRACGWVEK